LQNGKNYKVDRNICCKTLNNVVIVLVHSHLKCRSFIHLNNILNVF